MNNKIQLYFAKVLESISADSTPRPKGLSATASNKRFREFVSSRKLIEFALEVGWQLIEHDDKPPTIHNADNTLEGSLSISHSNQWVAIAIAPSNIKLGVDIELINERWTEDKAKIFCSSQEIEMGLALSKHESNKFFTKIWTQKEAFFKATQQPFVERNFNTDTRMTSSEHIDGYLYSVYSDPPTEIESKIIDLTSS